MKAVNSKSSNPFRNGKVTGPTGKGKRKPEKLKQARVAAVENEERLKLDTLDYMTCVLRPDLYTAKIPSMFPIPSTTAQTKGVSYFTANASGNFAAFLRPHNLGGSLVTYSAAALGEGVVWQTTTAVVSVPASILNYTSQFRLVGAYLKIDVLEPSLTRKGILTAGYLPYSPDNPKFTNDTLRDQPGVETVNAASTPKQWARYVPLDSYSLQFSNTYSGPCLAVCLSGGAAGTQIALGYRMVYEFVPNGDVTDLLVPTLSKPQDPHKALSVVQTAPTSGSWMPDLNPLKDYIKDNVKDLVKAGVATVSEKLADMRMGFPLSHFAKLGA